MTDFVLASASPRRRELMQLLTGRFEVITSDVDEDAVSKDAPFDIYVQELALLKSAAAAKFVIKNKNALVIGADTVVALDGRILGKPKNETDAFNMLKQLSGRTHEVYTGYCIMRIRDAYTKCAAVKTEVTFRALNDERIKEYIATGEPMDKAGAYGIQGRGSLLVKEIKGDYFNVVGFPVSEIAAALEDEFNISLMK